MAIIRPSFKKECFSSGFWRALFEYAFSTDSYHSSRIKLEFFGQKLFVNETSDETQICYFKQLDAS